MNASDADRDAPVNPSASARRAGRRVGASSTRDAIAECARAHFAANGFDGASLRAIARDAHVDVGMVRYFFHSKEELFRSVLELPFQPQAVLEQVLADGPAEVGTRLAQFVVHTLASEAARDRLVALVRSASRDNNASALIRETLTAEILTPLARRLGAHDASFRASLAMSQIAGLVLTQQVIGLDPLEQAKEEDLVAALAPTLQRYLTADLGTSGTR